MKKTRWILLAAAALLALLPLFTARGASFGGTDDAGSAVVAQVDSSYEPWAAPLLETLIGGELPGEVETLFFCVQTGIGVGILAYWAGRLVERKKWTQAQQDAPGERSAP